jgi:hypothetical protein
MWKSHTRLPDLQAHASAADTDTDDMRRRYHRICTRKSRLIARLCEEIARIEVKGAGMARIADKELSYYQQLLTAELLFRHGHHSQSQELAHRILHRATGAGETTMALLAGDLIFRLGGHGSTPLRQLKFVKGQRSWSDADYRQRQSLLIAEELLVVRRHSTDATYMKDLVTAEVQLRSYANVDSVGSIGPILKAIVIQRLLREGRNLEVHSTLSDARATARLSRLSSPSWSDVWYLTAYVRSLTAQGLFDEVLVMTDEVSQRWLNHRCLAHELLRHRMLAAMRSGYWSEACRVLVELEQWTHEQTDTIDIERCAVLSAYLHLAHELQLCPVDTPIVSHQNLPLIDSVSVIAEDRKGLGALVLIYDAIESFLHGDDDVTERKVLNLQVFASRNLKGPGTEALRTFIRFLRWLFVYRFSVIENTQRIRRYTKAFASEFEDICDQSVCPLDLTLLASALARTDVRRRGQTSV